MWNTLGLFVGLYVSFQQKSKQTKKEKKNSRPRSQLVAQSKINQLQQKRIQDSRIQLRQSALQQ